MRFKKPDKFISISGLNRILKRELNLSYKQPNKVEIGCNTLSTKLSRQIYITKLAAYIDRNFKLIFIDKTGFNL